MNVSGMSEARGDRPGRLRRRRAGAWLAFASVLAVFFGGAGVPVAQAATNVVKDAGLLMCINEKLERDIESPVTASDLESLTSLSCSSYGIESLSGLEYATNLYSFSGAGNKVSDLRPLSNLKQLSTIYMPDNKVSDFAVLANLPSLSYLNLDENTVRSIPKVDGGFRALKSLDLSKNQIRDLSGIGRFSALKDLSLSNNGISDIAPLGDLSNLDYLSLDYNAIVDVSPLAKIKRIGTLSLYDNHIQDFSPLKDLRSGEIDGRSQSIEVEATLADSTVTIALPEFKKPDGSVCQWTSWSDRVDYSQPGVATFATYGGFEAGDYIDVRTDCDNKWFDAELEARTVYSVKLNLDTEVAIGSSIQGELVLSPEDYPESDFQWSSEDTGVATVDSSGRITGVSEGPVFIHAVSRSKVGLSASQEIYVVPVLVEAISVFGPASLSVGESETLSVTVKPDNATNKTVLWSSHDPEIISVDANGRIKALGPGLVTIDAYAQDSFQDSLEVTGSIEIEVIQPVTAVKVSSASGVTSVEVGKQLALTAEVSPVNATDESVVWASSDSKVATVDASGKVTGVKAGTATITATAKDGSGKSGSFKVTVTPAVVKATAVKVSSTSGAATVQAGKALALKADVSPANASNKAVTWASSDSKIAAVDANGKVTGIKAGTATITATAKDGSNKAGAFKVTVTPAVVNQCVVKSGPVSFRDVPGSYSFVSDVSWLSRRGITTGWSDGTFRPYESVSRAAFAAFLYRMAGCPDFTPPVVSPFKDVPVTHQFYREISWLAAKGISTGYSDGSFRPEAKIRRDALSTFLYRFAGKPQFVVLKSFGDTAGSEHKRAIDWFASTGISTGWPDGTFRPNNETERGAIAAFLHRFDQKKIPIAVR